MSDYREFNPFEFGSFPDMQLSFSVELWDDSVGGAIETAANRAFSVCQGALRQFKSDTAYLLSFGNFRFLDERVRYEADRELSQLVPGLPW